MVAARRQVLAGLAVQVEPDGDRLARALVDHAQPHRPVRRGDRLDLERRPVAAAVPSAGGRSIGQVRIRAGGDVEAAGGVRRVLDDDGARRLRRLHVGVAARPTIAAS